MDLSGAPMTQPATDYQKILDKVSSLIEAPADVNDPTTRGYMIARAALVWVANFKGYEKAAELAYRLADELAGGKPK